MTHPDQMELFPEPPHLRAFAPSREAPPRRKRRNPRDGRGRHDNSLAAHKQLDHSPLITGRRAAIVAWLRGNGPATDRQVASGLGMADLNMVRPRITELLDCRALREVDRVKDSATGMTVRRVGVTGL